MPILVQGYRKKYRGSFKNGIGSKIKQNKLYRRVNSGKNGTWGGYNRTKMGKKRGLLECLSPHTF